jgi:hypothetical protein
LFGGSHFGVEHAEAFAPGFGGDGLAGGPPLTEFGEDIDLPAIAFE